MDSDNLKLKLFRCIDSLDQPELEQLHEVVVNFLSKQTEESEWDKLSAKQKSGILSAISEIEDGKGIKYQEVINKVRQKFNG